MHKKHTLLQTDTRASHTTITTRPISMHAHILNNTQHKRPKCSNRNWKQIPCAPQNLPNFSLQVSFSSSSFTSTGQSIFSCCWRSQVRPCAAAINAPCPTGHYRHHRVSQQPSIAKKISPSTTENASQSLQNPTRKKRNWRRISEVPPRGVSQASLCLQACACAPVNKTDHQCWTATHVSSTRPHELRVISVVLDAKLAHAQWPPSRSRVPTNAPSRHASSKDPFARTGNNRLRK